MSIVTQANSTSTWIPTFAGFSADPTAISARYVLNGKWCTVSLTMTAGTSNATTMTVTLPFAALGIVTHNPIVVNSGTSQTGRIVTAAGSNILTCTATPASGAFTATGAKNVFLAGFTYEIQ
jgi:hypothetical protein